MAACSGKKLYLTPVDAQRAAKSMRRHLGCRMAHFHCTHCHGWHIGNNTAPRRPREPR